MQPTDEMRAIEEISERLGNTPRKFDRKTARYLRMPVITGWDASEYLADADLLLENGTVVWGAVVMANGGLFKHQESGNPDLPGVVVFCPDPGSPIKPADLLRIASSLYKLYSEGTDDPELLEVAGLLKQDKRPMKAHQVPAKLSPFHRCLISSLLYKRDHFPLQTLEDKTVPVLYHPAGNGTVRMVPSRFWPPDMNEKWRKKSETKIPKPTIFARFLVVPKVIFLVKVTIGCLFILWQAPSIWSFVRQSEPLQEIQADRLGEMEQGTVFRFSGSLDPSRMLETERRVYVSVEGTDGGVWIKHRKSNGPVPSSLEKRVSVLEASSWLDSDLEKHINSQANGGKWPVFLLESSPAPTTGMKIYKIVLLGACLLILWGISRLLQRLLRF
jgi:hypothetical protein